MAGFFAATFTARGNIFAFKKNIRKRTEYIQPQLPYAFDALEPYIDAATMELHYSRHHAAYTKQFNAVARDLGIIEMPTRKILAEVSKYPESIRNNGGGYLNHILFWNMMSPAGGGNPSGVLSEAINSQFGSVENFKERFNTAAKSVFGSGWVWLISKDDKLLITTTQNQDNPLMDVVEENGFPILCLDVWEHAYYLKNLNSRQDYINNFWQVVNWDFVQKRYINSKKRNQRIS
jgi:superoxide dismutase, Fe-Mn family